MPFQPNILFPGMLADSAARVAQDAASRYPEKPAAALTAEMGWNAVLIPQEMGGAGGDFADLASIIEGLARHAVELPVITRCGIVPAMLRALPESPAARALLTQCAQGAATIELGGPLSPSEPDQPLAAQGGPAGWRLSGATSPVALTGDCTHVLLVGRAPADGAPLLACVDSAVLRPRVAGYRDMDDQALAVCQLDGLAVPDGGVLAAGAPAAQAIEAGWRMAVASLATDTVCCMGAALERTIKYLLERRQFGQALAEFQALRHEVSRLYVEYELARNLLRASLPGEGAQGALPGDAAEFNLLGLCIGRQAIQFAESVIQLHGGMGMTRELPAARLATRMMANAMRHGDRLGHQHSLNLLRDRTSP